MIANMVSIAAAVTNAIAAVVQATRLAGRPLPINPSSTHPINTFLI